MDTDVVALYCLTDDLLRASDHSDPPQRSMTDASAVDDRRGGNHHCVGGHSALRRQLRNGPRLPPGLPPEGGLHSGHALKEPVQSAPPPGGSSFALALPAAGPDPTRVYKHTAEEDIYLIDSFPASVCKNIRIPQTRIYGAEEGPKEEFRGYIASKDEYFFGVKVHLLVTAEGHPVEAFLTPGGRNDTRAMKQFQFNLPSGSIVIGDKAYNDYDFEDLLSDAEGIDLRPLRRKNSTRKEPAYVEYIQHTYRKQIETTGSDFERQLPNSIHAVTADGFELKVFLFVLAVSFGALV